MVLQMIVSYYQEIQKCLQTIKSLVQEVWFSNFLRMNILSSISDSQKKKICRAQFSDRKVSIFLKYRTYLTHCSKEWDGLCISWNIGIQPFWCPFSFEITRYWNICHFLILISDINVSMFDLICFPFPFCLCSNLLYLFVKIVLKVF